MKGVGLVGDRAACSADVWRTVGVFVLNESEFPGGVIVVLGDNRVHLGLPLLFFGLLRLLGLCKGAFISRRRTPIFDRLTSVVILRLSEPQ